MNIRFECKHRFRRREVETHRHSAQERVVSLRAEPTYGVSQPLAAFAAVGAVSREGDRFSRFYFHRCKDTG